MYKSQESNVYDGIRKKLAKANGMTPMQYDKMVFGYKIGNNMGQTRNGSDAGDDVAAFSRELDLAYMWDNDDIGASDWGPDPVGYMGGAFLESPGNPYDGIDNDNDGQSLSGPTISVDMFSPKILNLSDQIVVVNYDNFNRFGVYLRSGLVSSMGIGHGKGGCRSAADRSSGQIR